MIQKIITDKKRSIQHLYETHGLKTLKTKAESLQTPPNTFLKALQTPGLSLIAEVKKASPSKGIIRHEFNPIELAKTFTTMGAHALSVLTEENYFLGNPKYIQEIKTVTTLPILRKDFLTDPIQIYESKILGADAVLLIKNILSNEDCQTLIDLTHSLGMDALIEVHTQQELEEVLSLKNTPLIGINNRNLETFEVDISLSLELAHHIPPQITKVAESGYTTKEQLDELTRHTINAVLIGEGLAVSPQLTPYWRNPS